MCQVRNEVHLREKVEDENGEMVDRPLSLWKTKMGSHNCTSREKRRSDLA